MAPMAWCASLDVGREAPCVSRLTAWRGIASVAAARRRGSRAGVNGGPGRGEGVTVPMGSTVFSNLIVGMALSSWGFLAREAVGA